MAELVPAMIAVMLMVLGLSYLLQTDRWLRLTRRFMKQPERFFPAAVAMIAFGLAVGYGYNDWNGTWPLFVTLLGWLLALEGAVILLLPGLIQRLQRLSDRFLWLYLRGGGILLVLLGGLLFRSLR